MLKAIEQHSTKLVAFLNGTRVLKQKGINIMFTYQESTA